MTVVYFIYFPENSPVLSLLPEGYIAGGVFPDLQTAIERFLSEGALSQNERDEESERIAPAASMSERIAPTTSVSESGESMAPESERVESSTQGSDLIKSTPLESERIKPAAPESESGESAAPGSDLIKSAAPESERIKPAARESEIAVVNCIDFFRHISAFKKEPEAILLRMLISLKEANGSLGIRILLPESKNSDQELLIDLMSKGFNDFWFLSALNKTLFAEILRESRDFRGMESYLSTLPLPSAAKAGSPGGSDAKGMINKIVATCAALGGQDAAGKLTGLGRSGLAGKPGGFGGSGLTGRPGGLGSLVGFGKAGDLIKAIRSKGSPRGEQEDRLIIGSDGSPVVGSDGSPVVGPDNGQITRSERIASLDAKAAAANDEHDAYADFAVNFGSIAKGISEGIGKIRIKGGEDNGDRVFKGALTPVEDNRTDALGRELRFSEYNDAQYKDAQYDDVGYADAQYDTAGYDIDGRDGVRHDGAGYDSAGLDSAGYADAEQADAWYADAKRDIVGHADAIPLTSVANKPDDSRCRGLISAGVSRLTRRRDHSDAPLPAGATVLFHSEEDSVMPYALAYMTATRTALAGRKTLLIELPGSGSRLADILGMRHPERNLSRAIQHHITGSDGSWRRFCFNGPEYHRDPLASDRVRRHSKMPDLLYFLPDNHTDAKQSLYWDGFIASLIQWAIIEAGFVFIIYAGFGNPEDAVWKKNLLCANKIITHSPWPCGFNAVAGSEATWRADGVPAFDSSWGDSYIHREIKAMGLKKYFIVPGAVKEDFIKIMSYERDFSYVSAESGRFINEICHSFNTK